MAGGAENIGDFWGWQEGKNKKEISNQYFARKYAQKYMATLEEAIGQNNQG
jgi:hypothetical protein